MELSELQTCFYHWNTTSLMEWFGYQSLILSTSMLLRFCERLPSKMWNPCQAWAVPVLTPLTGRVDAAVLRGWECPFPGTKSERSGRNPPMQEASLHLSSITGLPNPLPLCRQLRVLLTQVMPHMKSCLAVSCSIPVLSPHPSKYFPSRMFQQKENTNTKTKENQSETKNPTNPTNSEQKIISWVSFTPTFWNQ